MTVSLLQVLLLPEGAEAVAYSDDFAHGEAASITAGARTARVANPPRGGHADRAEAVVAANVGQAAQPEVRFYYVNGVLNTQSMAVASAALIANRLTKHLQRSVAVTQVYNRSAINPAGTMLDGCAAASQLPPDHPAKDLAQNVCFAAKVCGGPGLIRQTLWESIRASFGQLVLQKYLGDPNFASDGVNVSLERLVREDIAAGRRAIIIGHSQGTLFVRNVLGRLSDLPEGSVGAFYISPAFGKADDLTTASTGFVILKGDAMSVSGVSGSTTTDPAPSQQGSPLDLHYINTYLQEGTSSHQVFLDGIRVLMKYVGASGVLPRSLGAAGRVELAAWRAGAGYALAATDCPPESSPGRTETPSPAAGASTWSVSFSDSAGLVSGTLSSSASGSECEARKYATGQGFDWLFRVRGPYAADKPYAAFGATFEQRNGYHGPGRYETGFTATFDMNDPATGYEWGGRGLPGSYFVVNDDEKSGSFDLTLSPYKTSPTPFASKVHVSGTFSCANLYQY